MIKFFRKIRKKLLTENKFSKYLLYAIGEIVLVVIGILIALQINNNNDLRKERQKELRYLENIKSDLVVNIAEMNSYIKTRTDQTAAAKRIIEYFEGKPLTDLEAFNADGMSIYSWQRYYQNNNTFNELVNSGNLAIINNEAIKKQLLDTELLYKKYKAEEDHFRFDTENNLYKPLYANMDLNPIINNGEYYFSQGKSGTHMPFADDFFVDFLANKNVKNGFVLAVLEFTVLNEHLQKMITESEQLIKAIDDELIKP
jgi:hypothetical protein